MNQALLITLIAILAIAYVRLLEWMLTTLYRRTRSRVVWVNGNTGALRITWEKKGSAIKIGERSILLDGGARMYGHYPTWIVDEDTGYSLMPPTRQAIIEDSENPAAMMKLMVSDPAIYHREIVMNRARDSLTANDEQKDPYGWIPVVAALCTICLVAIVGMIGWFIWKVIQTGQIINAPVGA